VHHYSAAATRPANQAFIAAWKNADGAASTPNFVAVGGWDGMGAIMHAVRGQHRKLDPDATLELLGTYKDLDSPARSLVDRSGNPRDRA
jgi:branched-chain amino acid transport system substrate-binding protein